jgi:urea transport system permease protein
MPATDRGRPATEAAAMSTLLDSLVAIATLLLVVFGLTLVLGVLDVINLAHAAFMAVGVYVLYSCVEHGVPFWAGCVLAAVGSAVLGSIIEWAVIRRLYQRPVDTILASWGIALVIVQVITLVAGAQDRSLDVPLRGSTRIFGVRYANYPLVLIVLAAALLTGLALLVRLTEIGRTVRMIMSNEPMARGLGINTTRVRQVTFTVGAGFAGLAGGVLGPLEGVSPQYATTLLIPAFLAVLVAGPTISGLLIGCGVLATVQTLFATLVDPAYSVAVLVLAAVIILRFAPRGLGVAR